MPSKRTVVPRRVRVAIAAVVMLAAGGIIALTMAGSTPGSSQSGRASELDRPLPGAASPSGASDPRPAPIAVAPFREPDTETAPATATPSSQPASRAAGIRVTGTVRYEGTDEAPGRFEFTAEASHLAGGSDFTTRVRGTNGRFTLEIPEAGEFFVHEFIVNGARNETAAIVTMSAEQPVQITLLARRALSLIVVDAATAAPLPGARAYAAHGELEVMLHLPEPPLDGALLHAGPDGVIELGEHEETTAWWVECAGHARAGVKISPGGTARRRVELAPGGELRLRVRNFAALTDPAIGIDATVTTQAGRWLTLPSPGADEITLVRGLPAGPLHVEVRRTAARSHLDRPVWEPTGTLYGQGETTIVAGRVTDLVIDTQPAGDAARVTVSGTISVPAAWNRPAEGVVLLAIDGANAGASAEVPAVFDGYVGVSRFSTSPLPFGRYRIEVRPVQWRTDVMVDLDHHEFALTVPAPGDVRLRVVDAASGAPPESVTLNWSTPQGGNTGRGRIAEDVDGPDAAGDWRFLAPEGVVHIEIQAPGYRSVAVDFQVTPGAVVRQTIRLERTAQLSIWIRQDGEFFDPRPLVAAKRLRIVDAAGVDLGPQATVSPHGFWCDDVPPGIYRVVFDGDERFAPKTAEVIGTAGRLVQHRFELVRRP